MSKRAQSNIKPQPEEVHDKELNIPEPVIEVVEAFAEEKGLPKKEVEELLIRISSSISCVAIQKNFEFSGPMPHPALLKLYEEQIPGMAKEHWNEIVEEGKTDRWCRKAREVSIFTGQMIGFALGMTGLFVGYKLSINGASGAGIAAMFGGLGTIIASICGKYFFYKDK